MSAPRFRTAVVLALVGAASSLVATAVRAVAMTRTDSIDALDLTDPVIAVTWPLAGLVLLHRDVRNRCGWLLVSAGAVGVYQLLGTYTIWNHHVAPLPGAVLTDWVSSFGFVVYLVVVPLVPLLFPDGRLPSPRWRRFVVALVCSASLVAVARMLVPGGVDVDSAVQNPFGVPGLAWLNVVVGVGALFNNVVGLGAAVVAIGVRTRRAVGLERRQLQWLLVGVLVMLAMIVVGYLTRRDLGFMLALLGPPLGVVAGTRRWRVDVDLVLRRGVVLVLVLLVVGAGGTTLLLQLEPDVTSTATGVAAVAGLAVAAALLREVLQRLVDGWWFPQERDADLLASRVMEAVTFAADPREALAELVVATRRVLRLPYVAHVGDVTVADGARPDDPAAVMLVEAVALGDAVGRLEVVPRRGTRGFATAERLMLDQVATQAALLAHAAALVADVDSSRARAVTAREEERRRLRNDLHDGVGPALAGLALQADALATRLAEPVRGEAMEVRDRLRAAVQEVRAVSHGLRPPVLDQIGLAAAVAQSLRRRGPTDATLDPGAGGLDGLPAAVEVVVLAVVEAATDDAVARGAARLRVEVERDAGRLVLRVADDGAPTPADHAALRPRVTEVGGRLSVRATPAGAVVGAVLPTEPLPTTREVRRL